MTGEIRKFLNCSYPNKTFYKGMLLVVTLIFCSVGILQGMFYSYGNHISGEKENRFQDSIRNIMALDETTPVPRGVREDSADDPAIWIHPLNSDSSMIIGTDKKGGLAVYNLEGKELFYCDDGKMNNADLRYGFKLAGKTIDILAVSNRANNSVSIYSINFKGIPKPFHKRPLITEMAGEVYGLCMYKSHYDNKFYVFVNSKEGEIEQWELFPSGDLVDGKVLRRLKLATQVEGMVADDETSTLFVGEEKTGIWKFNAEPYASAEGIMLPKSSEATNQNIRFDIEGLTVYSLADGKGYLIASSQGNNSFAVFQREIPHNYLGSFRIVDGIFDGVEGTDGIEVTNASVGKNFPNGLLVVQDGSNKDNGKSLPQNFKLVSWDSIAVKFNPPLKSR